MIQLRLWIFLEEYQRHDMPFSGQFIRWDMSSIYLITADINLDHLVKVVSARILHCKGTIFPFAINKYSGGDTLRLCTYSASLYTLTNFSTHSACSNYYSGSLVAIFYFPHSFYIY